MKFAAAFACTLISLPACAQKNSVIVKLCLPALSDVVSFPTIQAGIEYKLSNKISWYNEIGIQYFKPYYQKVDTNFLSSDGYKLKTEIRYYFDKLIKKSIKQFRLYAAANIFFTHQHYNSEAFYTKSIDSVDYFVDGFAVKREVLGANLLMGYQKPVRKKWLIDFYLGVGIRLNFIHTINQDFVYGSDRLMSHIDYTFSDARLERDTKGGFDVAPNLTMGFRICYKLR